LGSKGQLKTGGEEAIISLRGGGGGGMWVKGGAQKEASVEEGGVAKENASTRQGCVEGFCFEGGKNEIERGGLGT